MVFATRVVVGFKVQFWFVYSGAALALVCNRSGSPLVDCTILCVCSHVALSVHYFFFGGGGAGEMFALLFVVCTVACSFVIF